MTCLIAVRLSDWNLLSWIKSGAATFIASLLIKIVLKRFQNTEIRTFWMNLFWSPHILWVKLSTHSTLRITSNKCQFFRIKKAERAHISYSCHEPQLLQVQQQSEKKIPLIPISCQVLSVELTQKKLLHNSLTFLWNTQERARFCEDHRAEASCFVCCLDDGRAVLAFFVA